MSWISNLLRKIFGSGKAQKKAPVAQDSVRIVRLTKGQVNDFMARRERERQERIKEAESNLKDWIVLSLKERGSLSFTWESGNDEAFITFKDSNEAERENFEQLEEYIIDKLDIPDAGEFRMDGSGLLYIANNLIKAKYSSIMKGITDYDEETDSVTYSEEEHDSGDKVLFMI
jgi:hypothetical protein